MRRLIALLLGLELLEIFGLVRPLRLTSHYPGDPLGLFDVILHTWGATWRWTFLAVGLCLLFALAYELSQSVQDPALGKLIVGGSVALVFTCLFLYPATSNDLFHYVMESRILFVHHANPFTVAPTAYPTDPFAQVIVWENLASPYGPAWILLTGIPLLLGHGAIIWTFICFKLLAAAFFYLAGFSIFRIVRLVRPGHEWNAALLWLWNPLVIMYVAGNGANDAIMMGLTLLALYLGMRGRWRVAFPLLALATMVKFVSGVLVPVVIVYAFLATPRAGWRMLIESLLSSLALVIVLYAPFWSGTATFDVLKYQASQFTDSPPALLMYLLQNVVSPDHAQALTKFTSYTLFAAAYILIIRYLVLRSRRIRPADLAATTFAVICAYTMLSVFWFQPWYLIWLLSLGALSGLLRARLTMLFTFTGFLTHTATSIAELKNWYVYDWPREVGVVVVMVYAGPALLVALTLLRRSSAWEPLRSRAVRLSRRLSATGPPTAPSTPKL